MSANIPIEVTEQVIDVLQEDHGTLRQCALTCRAWLPRSRLHLFRSITLRERSNVYALASLLDTEISIEHLVQKAGIMLEKHTLLLDSFFAVLGHRLPRLQEISLTGSIYAGQFYPHITRRTCLHASPLTSVVSLRLHQVALRSFGDLARFLGTLKHLKHLILDSITWLSHGTYSSELVKSSSLALETLHMKNTCGPSPCVRTILRATDPTVLKDILVDACCAAQIHPSFEWFSVDLQDFVCLEKLSIYIHLDPTPLVDVEAALAVLSSISSPYLRHVHLDCTHFASARSELPSLLAALSEDLNAVLSRKEYSKLEEVCLRVIDDDQELNVALASSLKEFCKRGIVVVEFSEGRDDAGELRFTKKRVNPV